MSRPTPARLIERLLFAAWMGLMASPSGAVAQGFREAEIPVTEVAELEAQLDRLMREIDVLVPLAAREVDERMAREQAARSVGVQRFEVLPFQVVAPTDQRFVIQTTLERVLPFYRPYLSLLFSSEPPPVLAVWRYDDGVPEGATFADPGSASISVPADAGLKGLEARAHHVIGGLIRQALPSSLSEWMGVPFVEPGWHAALDRARIYRWIATRGSPVVQDCLEGLAAACWSGLGYPVDADDPTAEWYSSAQIRELALAVAFAPPGRRTSKDEERLRRACSKGGSESCNEILRRRSPLRPPLFGNPRSSLLHYALLTGGPDGLDRILESEETDVRTLISLAAGSPADELVTAWMDEVRTARPDPSHRLGVTAMASLAWLAVLAVAAVRSGPGRSV